MNADLKILETWCSLNRLSINSKKTKYVLFNRRREYARNHTIDLSINSDRLKGVDKYISLGVTLDNTLSYKPHIDRTVIGCSQRLFTLSKIRKYIPVHVATLIYKALVMSKLGYGYVLCIGAQKNVLNRLQKLQNRALRVCFCASRYTSNFELHLKTHILPVSLRGKLELYKIMYKRMQALTVNQTITSEENPGNVHPMTRYASARSPIFEKPRSSKYMESVTYQGPKLWADLPGHLKNLNHFLTFD